MNFWQPPALTAENRIDGSQDSTVYLVDGETYLALNPTPFAQPGKLVVQHLAPLLNRFTRAEVDTAIGWYIYRTNQFNRLGIRRINVPDFGHVGFCVESIYSDNWDDVPVMISPYVPGPQLEQILTMGSSPLNLTDLPEPEVAKINDIVAQRGMSLGYQMRHGMELISDTLRAASEIVHLDQTNIKFRWDLERDIPMLVITDIQKQIGQDVIF